jgi:hypothetical protein
VRQAGPRELVALGKRISDVRLKFTGLFGEPMVGRANLRATCGLLQRSASAPDSVRCANQTRGATVKYAKFGRISCTGQSTGPVRWRTGLSGAPLDRRQG